jgi:hypothetical protein
MYKENGVYKNKYLQFPKWVVYQLPWEFYYYSFPQNKLADFFLQD